MGPGPTGSGTGRSWFLLSPGCDGSRFYRVTRGTGLIPDESQSRCRTLVARLFGSIGEAVRSCPLGRPLLRAAGRTRGRRCGAPGRRLQGPSPMANSGAQSHGDVRGPAPRRCQGPSPTAMSGAQPHGDVRGPAPRRCQGPRPTAISGAQAHANFRGPARLGRRVGALLMPRDRAQGRLAGGPGCRCPLPAGWPANALSLPATWAMTVLLPPLS